ncbi:MAG: YggS family pyridoxal phosphate-dependent enzyme [Legionellaceae bacterium]|nr:YggS family pyridoxal phosphate-dependent enzyme [Legionellaceae bacterium]
MTNTIAARIQACLDTIHQAEATYSRAPNTVRLLAVSKNQTVESIQSAFEAGIHDFGESYWQEARDKQAKLASLPITWHFIGPIQRNKTKYIACHFNWVHSLCRTDIADILHEKRPDALPALNVCIQVNLDDEASKSGCKLDEVKPLAAHIIKHPNLKLRGLMAIPKKNTTEETAYQTFLTLKTALDTLNKTLNLKLDTLSMGMSDDFIPAIRAGSTCVRIGRRLFV